MLIINTNFSLASEWNSKILMYLLSTYSCLQIGQFLKLVLFTLGGIVMKWIIYNTITHNLLEQEHKNKSVLYFTLSGTVDILSFSHFVRFCHIFFELVSSSWLVFVSDMYSSSWLSCSCLFDIQNANIHSSMEYLNCDTINPHVKLFLD